MQHYLVRTKMVNNVSMLPAFELQSSSLFASLEELQRCFSGEPPPFASIPELRGWLIINPQNICFDLGLKSPLTFFADSTERNFVTTPLPGSTIRWIAMMSLNEYQETLNFNSWFRDNWELLSSQTEILPVESTEDPTARHVRLYKPELPENVINSHRAYALLVGVNKYNSREISNLQAAVQDVTALHRLLTTKYQVITVLSDAERVQPTRGNILRALKTLTESAAEGDLLLFHFSGHGIAEGGESYLLPQDAELPVSRDGAISMADVRAQFEASAARCKVIIVDACYIGASIGRAKAATEREFIKHVFKDAEGVAVLASCKQTQRAWEWTEKKHGVFTYYLLEALHGRAASEGKDYITVTDAGRYVTDHVKRWALKHNKTQTPTLEYKVVGDIILLHLNKKISLVDRLLSYLRFGLISEKSNAD